MKGCPVLGGEKAGKPSVGKVLEGCQLDDTKPILGDSDINIDAK